jgi:non-ribosomal peptide synthetase component F
MRVRQAVMAGLEHQDLPFERLVRELRPDRAVAANPLTGVAFSFQDMPPAPSSWAGLQVSRAPVPTGADKFDLALNLTRAGDEIHGLATYRGGLEATSVQRLCQRFERLLAAAVADPRRRLAPPEEGR